MTSLTASSGAAPLFHLVPTQVWNELPTGETYFPATYANDGFTHLTSDPALLLEVANHFYTSIQGDFIVLELDTRLLLADKAGEVKYEPAAPVGETETKSSYDGASEDVPLFPHLYGGIPKGGRSVVGPPLLVTRDASTGQFLSIEYPMAAITANIYVASSAAVSNIGTMNQLGTDKTFASLCLTSTEDAPQRPLAFTPAMEHTVQLADNDALSTELPIINCLGFLDSAIQAGHVVIIHSSHGVSRASSIAVAHLMFNNGTSLPETLATVRKSWPRAAPRPYFMSQLSELDQGDGHDASIAARAVAAMNGGDDSMSPAILQEDEIESIIEFGDDDVAPIDSDDEADPMNDDDDALRMAAAAGENGVAPDIGIDPLPEEIIVETARTVFQGHTDSVCCIAASPVSSMIVSGGCDDHAILWNASTGKQHHVLGDATDALIKETVAVCAFNFDGTLVATGALDGSVCIWNVETGTLVQALEGPEEDINWISWHPRGNVILAGSSDMLTWMWMGTTGDCMQVFSGHSGPVTCGSFAPNGKFIVTASSDGTAKVWNPKTGKCRHKWHDQDVGGILSLSISADCTTIVTGGEDGTARMGAIVKKKERVIGMLKHRREGSMNGHVVESVGFNDVYSENKGIQLVFTAGSAGLLVVWDRNTLETRYECRHTGGIVSASFCTFAPILWTCSSDESACVWDSRSGELIQKYTGHKDVVLTCCVVQEEKSKGGWGIVTGSDDRECRVFYEAIEDGETKQ